MVTAREINVKLNHFRSHHNNASSSPCSNGTPASGAATSPVSLNSLDQSDREEQLGAWLDAHQVADPLEACPVFVETALSEVELDELVPRSVRSRLNEVLAAWPSC